jgi:hypothetical protein
LQVAQVSIMEDDWWAHFQMANQNTAAASVVTAQLRSHLAVSQAIF